VPTKRRELDARVLAGGVALLGAAGAIALTTDLHTDRLKSRPDPATDYDAAMARFGRLQARDGADVNPRCRSTLLSHEARVEDAVVLFHGLANCPCQFVELAPRLYERGYNVLIPRMPGNGLRDRRSSVQKHLRAEDLCAYGDAAVDIAMGLGERVTLAGLSAGGTVVAWLAHYRVDVARAVLLAPQFGIGGRISPLLSVLEMHLALKLPNVSTERIAPFQDPPEHSALGFSTRAVGQIMRLGTAVRQAAATARPGAQSIAICTNPNDHAVNDLITWQLAQRWWAHGLRRLEIFDLPANAVIEHDTVDPAQPYARADVTYPILLELIAPAEAPRPPSGTSS
jgi:pimeloyl-ACP methyl ester carboxylesterase